MFDKVLELQQSCGIGAPLTKTSPLTPIWVLESNVLLLMPQDVIGVVISSILPGKPPTCNIPPPGISSKQLPLLIVASGL
jgi:hypothetical protein